MSALHAVRYAWRNLWRNGRRTAITLAAVALSTAVLVLVRALMHGLVRDAIGNATNVTVGEVQLHAPGYLRDQSLYRSLPDPARIVEAAGRRAFAAAPRSYGYGLVARGTKSAGALFWGVDPALERAAFDLPRHIAEGAGAFLPDAPARGVVLGKKLARSLDAAVGAELVVVVQAADGSLGSELYTVTGILKAAGEAIDRSAAILHHTDFEELFVSGGRVHEIAFNTRGALPLAELAALVAGIAPGQEVRTWRQVVPVLSDMLATMDVWLWIFGAIFLLAAGLGVMNTMLMATHERIREFGILKALGTSPWRIARDVAVEALVLAIAGTVLGVALGAAGSAYFERHGIDTTAVAGETTIGGLAFDPIWHAALEVSALPAPALVMWVICVLASLYPAVLAARLEPVRAMQHV